MPWNSGVVEHSTLRRNYLIGFVFRLTWIQLTRPPDPFFAQLAEVFWRRFGNVCVSHRLDSLFQRFPACEAVLQLLIDLFRVFLGGRNFRAVLFIEGWVGHQSVQFFLASFQLVDLFRQLIQFALFFEAEFARLCGFCFYRN